MRAEDIRELTDDEIRSRIVELQDERFRLRFRSATQTLEDPLRLRTLRRDVARMQTVLRQRALGIAAGTGAEAAAARKTAKRTTGGRRTRTRKTASRKTTGTRAARAQER